ncbi:porin [Polynucleobacter sp. UB-Raua-W9]|uniref:porin n=1 Tax=Polynucleobacter sp. UB-Raua-W9 TaxID=1819736 RepID=UPI001BFD76DC|nr:porin [Polynucleobacter sp. UB-Raua-W9]QWD72535.1 porin [Polynucleobacter sp. UB-Raua-W9]
MKKSLFALAAVGALSGVVHAQSSVTVYGIIDEGLSGGNTQVSNGGAVNTSSGVIKSTGLGFTSGNQSTSRLGFKGNEDLGGGLSAFFTYEIKMDNDSTAGWSTARQAFVGVKKNGWGSIAAGTQNTPIYDAVLSSDPGAVNNIAGNLVTTSSKGPQGALPSGSGVATNQPYATRLANTASIKTDNFSGFTARALILASAANTTETTTNTATTAGVGGSGVLSTVGTASTTNNQSGFGIGADYTWQKLLVTANYQSFKATSTLNTVSTTPTLFSPGGVTTAATNSRDAGQYYAATYDFGILKAFGQYINRKVSNDTNTAFFQKYTAQQIGVRSFVTPTVEVWGSAAMGKYYAYPTLTGTAGATTYMPGSANLNAFQLGANYWLSKRSNLYAIYGQTATSNYSNTSATSNPVSGNQNNYSVGVRHTF